MPTQIEGINFYTIQETATYLGLTAQTIRTYIRKGRLKSYKISGPILITENSLKEFLGVKALRVRKVELGQKLPNYYKHYITEVKKYE